ncbi:hypothetical protein HDU93_000277 [Gonapodya sp. JEL0774]|nr:hypothetical protein HDU93_000277 [Gonapodya sp. JEL0774]
MPTTNASAEASETNTDDHIGSQTTLSNIEAGDGDLTERKETSDVTEDQQARDIKVHEILLSGVERESHALTVKENEAKVGLQPEEEPKQRYAWTGEGGLEGALVIVASAFGMFFGMGLMFTWGVYMRFYYYNNIFPSTSLFQLAFVGSMNMAFQNIIGPFMGFIQDRLGNQLCVLAGAAMLTGSFILASFCTQFWQLLLTQGVMYGISTAFMYFTFVSVPIQYYSRNRALAIGIVVSGSGLGGMSLGPLTQRMIDALGYTWALRITGLMSGTVVGLTSIFLKGKNRKGTQSSSLLAFEFFKDANFSRLFLSSFFMMWGFFIPFGYIPSFAVNIGLSASDGAFILGMTNGASAAGRVIIGYYADRIGNVNALTVCQVVSAVFYFGLWPFAKSYAPLLVFGLGFGFFSGGFISLFPSFIAQVWGVDRITQRMGIQFSGSLPGAIAGQSVAGLFLDHYTTKFADGSIVIDYVPAILWGASMFSVTALLTIWTPMQRSTPPFLPILATSVLTLSADTPVTDLFEDFTVPANIYYKSDENISFEEDEWLNSAALDIDEAMNLAPESCASDASLPTSANQFDTNARIESVPAVPRLRAACSPVATDEAIAPTSQTSSSAAPHAPSIRPTAHLIALAIRTTAPSKNLFGRPRAQHGTASATPISRLGSNPAGMFRLGKNKREGGKGAKVPGVNEDELVGLFWHADEQLLNAVHRLREVPPYTYHSSRLAQRTETVHKRQKVLLDTLYLLAEQVDRVDSMKDESAIFADRSYRRTLPLDDQRELEFGYSENIMFAAQALSTGFRIRGVEAHSPILTPPAQQLTASFEALRWVIRGRAVRSPRPPYDDEAIRTVLRDFDRAWCTFEEVICEKYFSAMYMGRSGQHDVDMFSILMSETLLRAISHNYMTLSQILEYDPVIFLALPRLTVVGGLLHFPGMVDLVNPETCIRWFRHKCTNMRELRWELEALEARELAELERMLCGGTESDTDNVDTKSTTVVNQRIQRVFMEVCGVADDLQTGPKAREFVQVLNSVLSMYKESEPEKGKSGGGRGAEAGSRRQIAQGSDRKKRWSWFWSSIGDTSHSGGGGGTTTESVQASPR